MGNMCGGDANSAKLSTVDLASKPSKLKVTMNTPGSTSKPGEEWRNLPLSAKVHVQNVHAHVLQKFKSESDEIPDNLKKTLKSAGDKPEPEAGDSDEYDEEDEGKWQCNGTVHF